MTENFIEKRRIGRFNSRYDRVSTVIPQPSRMSENYFFVHKNLKSERARLANRERRTGAKEVTPDSVFKNSNRSGPASPVHSLVHLSVCCCTR